MSKLLHKAVRQKSENAYSIYQQHLANRPVNVSLKFAFILMHVLSVTRSKLIGKTNKYFLSIKIKYPGVHVRKNTCYLNIILVL